MSTATIKLASAMKGGPPTPEHCAKAITLLEDDGEFADDKQAQVMVLFA
jgi:hypothetical protein